MRGKILLILAVILALVVLPGSKSEKKGELLIYNWQDYMSKDVVKDFEKEFNVKVTIDTFSTQEEMLKRAKTKKYDLIIPAGDYVSIMKKQNMLQRLDKSLIPNFQYIDKKAIDKIKFDVGNNYSIPYMFGIVGVAVNRAYITDYPRNTDIFLMPELKGKIIFLEEMRDVIGLGLIKSGYSANTVNLNEITKAKDVILNWKKNILRFDSKTFVKSINSGEVWVVFGYCEDILSQISNRVDKKNMDFFIPEEGSTMYIDSFVIPVDAKNVDNAYKFINYIHTPTVYERVVDYLELPSINTGVNVHRRKIVPKYTINDSANCEFTDDVGDAIKLYENIWSEITKK